MSKIVKWQRETGNTKFHDECVLVMFIPILGSSNSAANKDMMSKI